MRQVDGTWSAGEIRQPVARNESILDKFHIKASTSQGVFVRESNNVKKTLASRLVETLKSICHFGGKATSASDEDKIPNDGQAGTSGDDYGMHSIEVLKGLVRTESLKEEKRLAAQQELINRSGQNGQINKKICLSLAEDGLSDSIRAEYAKKVCESLSAGELGALLKGKNSSEELQAAAIDRLGEKVKANTADADEAFNALLELANAGASSFIKTKAAEKCCELCNSEGLQELLNKEGSSQELRLAAQQELIKRSGQNGQINKEICLSLAEDGLSDSIRAEYAKKVCESLSAGELGALLNKEGSSQELQAAAIDRLCEKMKANTADADAAGEALWKLANAGASSFIKTKAAEKYCELCDSDSLQNIAKDSRFPLELREVAGAKLVKLYADGTEYASEWLAWIVQNTGLPESTRLLALEQIYCDKSNTEGIKGEKILESARKLLPGLQPTLALKAKAAISTIKKLKEAADKAGTKVDRNDPELQKDYREVNFYSGMILRFNADYFTQRIGGQEQPEKSKSIFYYKPNDQAVKECIDSLCTVADALLDAGLDPIEDQTAESIDRQYKSYVAARAATVNLVDLKNIKTEIESSRAQAQGKHITAEVNEADCCVFATGVDALKQTIGSQGSIGVTACSQANANESTTNFLAKLISLIKDFTQGPRITLFGATLNLAWRDAAARRTHRLNAEGVTDPALTKPDTPRIPDAMRNLVDGFQEYCRRQHIEGSVFRTSGGTFDVDNSSGKNHYCTDQNAFYQNGYLHMNLLSEEGSEAFLKYLEVHIGELKILAQDTPSGVGTAQVTQFFSWAPSYQGLDPQQDWRVLSQTNEAQRKICTLLLKTQFESMAKLSVLKGLKRIDLAQVGLGAFNNPPEVLQAMLEGVMPIAKKAGIPVVLHGFREEETNKWKVAMKIYKLQQAASSGNSAALNALQSMLPQGWNAVLENGKIVYKSGALSRDYFPGNFGRPAKEVASVIENGHLVKDPSSHIPGTWYQTTYGDSGVLQYFYDNGAGKYFGWNGQTNSPYQLNDELQKYLSELKDPQLWQPYEQQQQVPEQPQQGYDVQQQYTRQQPGQPQYTQPV